MKHWVVVPLLSTGKLNVSAYESASLLQEVITNEGMIEEELIENNVHLVLLLNSSGTVSGTASGGSAGDDLSSEDETTTGRILQLFKSSKLSDHITLVNDVSRLLESLQERMKKESSCTICCQSSWRFQSVVMKRLMTATGDVSVVEEAKLKYKTASELTKLYSVEIADDHSLRSMYSIREVIYVLGPNRNPEQPDFIKSEKEAYDLIRKTYQNIFHHCIKQSYSERSVVESASSSSNDALISADNVIHFGRFDPPPVGFGTSRFNWQNSLIDVVEHPNTEQNKRKIMYRDAQCALVYDAYPKSKVHLLCVAATNVNSVSDLNKTHVALIKHMQNVIQMVIAHLTKEFPGTQFKAGCHSVPSLNRLHIHVNSCDFITDCMKNKKHYNSFCTDFYVPVERVVRELEEKGRVQIDKEAMENLLKGELKCHICSQVCKTIPALKTHLSRTCLSS